MMKKILAASILTVALAAPGALAQSMGGSASGSVPGGISGSATGSVSGDTTGSVSGGATGTTDTTTTSSTNKSNGMEDRCKDSGGYDTDNNTPSGAMTSDMQNCNK
ncbi:hypothetical protein RFM26_09625 [Mesorhizobium sp. VK23B]|uniref:Oxidoreductase n=1 Tax=Mesorhizobium dulcispinae TaxID=3072316 RepID=A0ABU4XAC1_9HYPH|nr:MULTISPECIES: hypothetical protein [unclassified Mesorhizobium]MDX8465939.1 hypothetical protein [Mesorhizobium sp. VK23B]MDX8471750.1 hypothetical protein [Mesorhizobium sp. VK23A]